MKSLSISLGSPLFVSYENQAQSEVKRWLQGNHKTIEVYFEWPFTFFNSHFSFLHTIGNTMLVSSPFQVSILQWIHRHSIMKITKTFFRYVIPISTMGIRAFLQSISMSERICMYVYVCVVIRMFERIVLRLISCMDNDQT